MITAIYIKDGRTQLVLTPETTFEKGIVSNASKGERTVKIYTGSFYDCMGGWSKQGASINSDEDKSLIIVMDIKEVGE